MRGRWVSVSFVFDFSSFDPCLRKTNLTLHIGNIGGIIATFSFLKKDAPKYTKGYSISIAFVILSALSCTAYFFMCNWANRRRNKSVRDVGLTEYEKTEMGDLNPDYRYLL